MRKQFSKKDLGGFTIIEVIIVLAIAGLIMIIVFLAVPQLQRNSRDQSRKSVASRIKSEIENYASNNAGSYPFNNPSGACPAATGTSGDWPDFFKRYLSTVNIKDAGTNSDVISCSPGSTPSASASYVAAYSAGMTLPAQKGVIAVITGASCSGEGVTASTGANSYALVIGLDRNNTRFCVDNG